MIKRVVSFALHQPLFIVLMVILFISGGVAAFMNLPIEAFPDETFTGRVDKVSEFIDPNTRTIKVRGSVDNPRRLLKAEMFVNVSLPDGAASTISVPAAAVFLKGDKHFVFVQEKPGQFTRQEVAIGSEEAGRVLILNGLQAGQQVVTDGCVFLQELIE